MAVEDVRENSVIRPKAALLTFGLLASLGACLGGCATVAVYEPTASAEMSLTKQQSELHVASEAYCRDTLARGLASGETNLGSLAGMLSGKGADTLTYARKVGAERAAPATVVSRVRGDVEDVSEGLAKLNGLAQKLMTSTRPTKSDVSEFERALIHARQARDSFADALALVNKRASREYEIGVELQGLDKTLAGARLTADDLAAARTSAGGLAELAASRAAG